MAEGKFLSVGDILYNYSEKIVENLKKNLEKSGANASQSLWQSIAPIVKVFGEKYTMTISAEDYWKFVDMGIKGRDSTFPESAASPFKFKNKMPPVSAFSGATGWIAMKGIPLREQIKMNISQKTYKPRKKKLSDIVKRKNLSVAWGIAKTIQKKGVRGTHFVSDYLNESFYANLKNDISKAIGKDVTIQIKNYKT